MPDRAIKKIYTYKMEFNTLKLTSPLVPHMQFFAMFAIAIVGIKLPILKHILLWFEVFFHELSHALATLFTFGSPKRLKLTWHGGGTLTSSGGIPIFILFAGYTGATLWGTIIYLIGVHTNGQTAELLLIFLFFTIILSTLFLVRDLTTFCILLIISSTLSLPLYGKAFFTYTPQLLQFIGLSVSLNALHAPLQLLNRTNKKQIDDATALAKKTLIPAIIWILTWVFISMVSVLYMWQIPLQPHERIINLPLL